MSEPKFPHVRVPLIGNDGDAFMVMGLVIRALKAAGVDKGDIDAYREAAMSGDYDNLLQVTMGTVTITSTDAEPDEDEDDWDDDEDEDDDEFDFGDDDEDDDLDDEDDFCDDCGQDWEDCDCE